MPASLRRPTQPTQIVKQPADSTQRLPHGCFVSLQIFDISWDLYQPNKLVSCGVKHIKVRLLPTHCTLCVEKKTTSSSGNFLRLIICIISEYRLRFPLEVLNNPSAPWPLCLLCCIAVTKSTS